MSWVVLAGESTVAKKLAQSFAWQAPAIGGLAILSLLLDFGQYIFGYRDSDRLRKEMEEKNLTNARYDYDSCWYKAQMRCFVGKQLALGLSGLWLVTKIALLVLLSR